VSLLRAASVVQMGVVAGTLGFVSFGVGQPGGLGLLGLAVVAAVTGWGISGRARWARVLGFVVAIACAAAGVFGLYGLVALIAYGLFSRANLAVLGVLLLSGVTSVVLAVALLRDREPPGALIDVGARPRATRLAIGFALGIGVAALFGFALSMVAEPPCCPL